MLEDITEDLMAKEISPVIHSDLMAKGSQMDWDLGENVLVNMERYNFEPFGDPDGTHPRLWSASKLPYATDGYGRWLQERKEKTIIGDAIGVTLMGFLYSAYAFIYAGGYTDRDIGYRFFSLYDENDRGRLVTACFLIQAEALMRKLGRCEPRGGRIVPCGLQVRHRRSSFRPVVEEVWRLVPETLDYADNCAIGRSGHSLKLHL